MTGRRTSKLAASTTSQGDRNMINVYSDPDLLRRNQASLVAFTLPQKWRQGAGVSIVATHVDSPNLKVRRAQRVATDDT